MEQPSVLTQTSPPENPQTTMRYRWMRYFFTEDVSPDNRPIVELQRRATWIGLALLLQSFSESSYILQSLKSPVYILYALPGVLTLVLVLGSFAAMWMAFRPNTLKQQTHHLHKHPRLWQRLMLLLLLALSVVGSVGCIVTLVLSFLPPQYSNDGTSLDTNAAVLLSQGRNPYTDSNILDVVRRFQIQPNWTTPLQQGQFAHRLEYPTLAELQSVMTHDLKTGNAPEFESKVSYPALSFLTLVPFILLKDYNVLPLYLLCYLLLLAVAYKVARPELRPWVLLLGMANVPMWSTTASGNLDILYVLFIVIAWLMRNHRWRSAVFLGLAIASKQIAWLFLPFYLIMIWRQYGLAEAIRRLTIAAGIFLVCNLPFILWNPQAWLAGVLVPIADPMFPLGEGLINLSIVHLLPFFSTSVYQVLEGIALLLSLAWYWRLSRRHPEAAMLLAVVPLLFAWRSLPTYFYCAAFPIFVLMVAKTLRPSPVGEAQDVPVPIGVRAAIYIAHLFRNMTPPGSYIHELLLSLTQIPHERKRVLRSEAPEHGL